MCSLRLFRRNKLGNVTDFTLQIPLVNINIIDRPAFCVYSKNDNNYINIIFKYSNIDEGLIHESSDHGIMLADVGIVSGCFYAFSYNADYILTDGMYYSIASKLKSQNSGIRFQTNVSEFVKLIKQIVPELIFD